MKKLILALTIVLSGSLCEASVLSFKAWKARRVNEARSAVRQFKGDLQTAKKSGHEDSIKTQEIRLEQAEINVEITQELGPTDYFVLYLAKNFPKDSSAVRQAVTKMSQSEVAEILMSYQKKMVFRKRLKKISKKF